MGPEKKAKEIVNRIYQPLGYLDCKVSSRKMWEYAKDRALEFADDSWVDQPMYTGSLNPRWKFWQEVKEEIKKL